MQLTIQQYCVKKKIGPRYIQQLIKEQQFGLLAKKWGINKADKIGNTYLLTVDEKYFEESAK